MGQTGTSQAWGLVGCGREFGLHPKGSRETLKGLGFYFSDFIYLVVQGLRGGMWNLVP